MSQGMAFKTAGLGLIKRPQEKNMWDAESSTAFCSWKRGFVSRAHIGVVSFPRQSFGDEAARPSIVSRPT